MNAEARVTVDVVRARGWTCVRLRPKAKKPDGARWQMSADADVVAGWFEAGANVGLVCGETSKVAVLDPDELLEWADMIDTLGQPCLPWVLTGSGKLHYYIAWIPDLPAKILSPRDGRTVVGEIQRGPGLQQVVLPGSIHPDTGLGYRWITERLGILCEPIDPVHDPLPDLAKDWRAWFYSAAP